VAAAGPYIIVSDVDGRDAETSGRRAATAIHWNGVLFTTELLTAEQSAKFTPLVNTIKAATMKHVMAGELF
jgi:hypothetical protein